MTTTEREPNAEAGDYIENDPAAWVAWVATFREYAPQFGAMAAHLGTEDAAAEVLAGTALSVLADQHDLYLQRGAEYDNDRLRRIEAAARDWASARDLIDYLGATEFADAENRLRAALTSSTPEKP